MYASFGHGICKMLLKSVCSNNFLNISTFIEVYERYSFWAEVLKKHIDNSCIIKDGDIVYDTPESQLKMWRTHYYNVLNESIDEAQNYDNDFKYVVESEVEQLNNSMSKDDSPAGINLHRLLWMK